MMRPFRQLLRRVAALRDPKPRTLDQWIADHHSVVEAEMDRIEHLVPEDGIVVDVGANVGLFTESLLRRRPGVRVVCFEPVKRYHDVAVERLKRFPQVEIHPMGLSNAIEDRPIWLAPHNPGANSVMDDIMFDRRENSEVREDTQIVEEQIHLTTWSAFAAEKGIDEVHFVKTDTEGFDYAVLDGMLDFLRKTTRLPVLYTELLHENYHPRWDEQQRVVDALLEIGYGDVDLESMKKVDNILFLPRDADDRGEGA